MNNGVKSKTELANELLFGRTMRGIPTDVVAYAFSRLSPGINWVGCSKAHMAQEWANENPFNVFRGRGSKPTLPAIFDRAMNIVQERQKRRDEENRRQTEWNLRKAAEAEAKKADDALLDEVFDFAESNLREMGALGKLAQVIRLRKKLNV
jgi:hypothetical protein